MDEAHKFARITVEPRSTGNVVALPRPAAAVEQPLTADEIRRLRVTMELVDKLCTGCPAARRALFDL